MDDRGMLKNISLRSRLVSTLCLQKDRISGKLGSIVLVGANNIVFKALKSKQRRYLDLPNVPSCFITLTSCLLRRMEEVGFKTGTTFDTNSFVRGLSLKEITPPLIRFFCIDQANHRL